MQEALGNYLVSAFAYFKRTQQDAVEDFPMWMSHRVVSIKQDIRYKVKLIVESIGFKKLPRTDLHDRKI